MNEPDYLEALHALVEAFEEIGIRHFVGGSVGSSVYGLPRTTLDVDLVADLRQEHVEPLVGRLEGRFYVDAEMALEAIEHRSSLNVIHLRTMVKIDVFVLKRSRYDREAFARARDRTLPGATGDHTVRFAAPEDIVLHKLTWYLSGDRVSERQWSDVIGVLKVQGDSLDFGYMARWAEELGVVALFRDAMKEAGLPG